MQRNLLLIFIVFLLSSCDAFDDMTGMFEKQELVQNEIKRKYGWESQVAFNIHNGTLTQVTLLLNASEVGDQKVADLELIAKEVIDKTFKSEPQRIFIQISSIPDEK